jgi:hypothetical protein
MDGIHVRELVVGANQRIAIDELHLGADAGLRRSVYGAIRYAMRGKPIRAFN